MYGPLLGTTRYWRHPDGTKIIPSARQLQFLKHATTREVLYAGGGNSGKTMAAELLMAQFAHRPDWHVLALRDTYKALSNPGGLAAEAYRMFGQFPDAHINLSKQLIEWESGASFEFGHISSLADIRNYQGRPKTCLIIDEMGQVPYEVVTELSTWVRYAGPVGDDAPPLMIRLLSNTLGPYIEDLEERFIDVPSTASRVFIPALHTDLPFDTSDWAQQQHEIQDAETYAAYVLGEWKRRRGYRMINVNNLTEVDEVPEGAAYARVWDLADTVDDGDYTAGLRMARIDEDFYLDDIELHRKSPGAVTTLIKATAASDGPSVPIGIEILRNGKAAFALASSALPGYDVRPCVAVGDKEVRARPFAVAVDHGHVYVTKRFKANREAMNQLRMFPTKGVHDDVVDVAAYAHGMLATPAIRSEVW